MSSPLVVKGRNSQEVYVSVTEQQPFVQLEVRDVGVSQILHLDENHAAALVLFLQGCIAEIQARAVGL